MRKFVLLSICIALIAALVYFTQAQQLGDKAQLGRELFHDPTFNGTLEPKNITGLSCADCHADFDEAAEPDGLIRSGHSVIGVPSRGEAKGGMISGADFARAAGGGGFCYEHFLQKKRKDKVNPTAIPAEHAEALMAYFDAISGDNKGPQFEMEMLDDEAKIAAGEKIAAMPGDAKKGWKLFGRACVVCHTTPFKGGVGPYIIRPGGRLPRDMNKKMVQWAKTIRGGGITLMPFYASDILSDQDIADIVTFLREQMEKSAR